MCSPTKKLVVPIVVVCLLAAAALACGSETASQPEEGPPTNPPATAVDEEAQTQPTVVAEATSTPTPIPTDTPEPTDTPIPTATTEPTPVPEPVMLTGTGNSVVDVGEWKCVPGLVHIVGNAGSDYFGVENFDAAGEQLELLANTTDPYDGWRPLDWMDDECTARFQVQAAGDWSITLYPLAPILEVKKHQIGIPGTYKGTGDDVIILAGAANTPDLANVSGNAAERFFAVMAWTSKRGSDQLLVNTTEAYQGTVILDPTTLALEVRAAGAWTVEVTAK